MAAPNLIATNTITGATSGTSLSSTSAISVLSNASSSGKVYKVNTLNVSNTSLSTTANVTVSFYSAASLGGTAYPIVSMITIIPGSSLTVIDKGTQYYLQEDTSIGANANIANTLSITVSYEDIS